MSAPRPDDARAAAFRRALAARHAGVEPDAAFSARVLARLPRSVESSFDWAVRRVLPVSLALVAALTIAVAVTGRGGVPAASRASATPASSGASDPLEFLLDGGRETR